MQKRNPIHALELGGTLFVPASHKNLAAILSGEKYPALRSVVIDFEDGLADADRPEALNNLPSTLAAIKENKLLRFIRPQDPKMLETFLEQKHIEKIDGFILPKFGLDNANEYLSIIQNSKLTIQHYLMPSIEGEELFDTQKLRQLRDILLPYQDRIICIRFGAEDMLRQLGLRRPKTLHSMTCSPPPRSSPTSSPPSNPPVSTSAPRFTPTFPIAEGFKQEIHKRARKRTHLQDHHPPQPDRTDEQSLQSEPKRAGRSAGYTLPRRWGPKSSWKDG